MSCLNSASRAKRVDPNRAEKMAARILIGVERSERTRKYATENLYHNCQTVTLMAAAFTRAAER